VDSYAPASKGKANESSSNGIDLISSWVTGPLSAGWVHAHVLSNRQTLISLNRFEAKKNVALAIQAFAKLRSDALIPSESFTGLRLVVGGESMPNVWKLADQSGGYDTAEADNVKTLSDLQTLCDEANLTHHTVTSPSAASPPATQVLFITNFTTAQRAYLLTSPSTLALLYTPANEHFGIVPVEAMSCGLPVLACDSGGPTESIIDLSQPGGTGLLRTPNAEEWSAAIAQLIELPNERRAEIAKVSKKRVNDNFSIETLGRELEEACKEAVALPDLHTHIGDKLIWGGAAMMAFAAINLALIFLVYGVRI
jgi:alpha-1,3/alpha-1,6-mannosyltransferase